MTVLALALALSACEDGKAQEAATGGAAGAAAASPDQAGADQAGAAGKPSAAPAQSNIQRIPIAV
ncbi:MAG TPA: hypothetical protein VKB80_31715, partial [Kofleriaceae bacterium]|nr:hypothetical protein [Kofleriaceae bacterium]